jgi:uncharacterized protein DUF4339
MMQSNMTNRKNDVEELEELLTELEQEGALVSAPYSEEDDVVTQLMEAPLDDQHWLVQITALDRRMLTGEQLLAELRLGQLVNEQTLVWRGGMDEWVPIAQVVELLGGPLLAQPPRSGVVQLPPPPVPIPPPARMGSNTARFPLPRDARLTPTPPSSALGLPPPPPPNPWVPPPPSSALGLPPPPPAPSPSPQPLNPMHGLPTVPAGLLPPLAPVPTPPSSALGQPPGEETSSTLLSAQLPKAVSPEPAVEGLSDEADEPEEPSPAAELPPAALAPTLVRHGKAVTQRSAVNTQTGPVSADFSELSPPRSNPVRLLVGSGVAALLAILGTSYALSSAGVFESPATEVATQQSREVSALQPTGAEAAPGSAAKEPAAAEPVSAPTAEPVAAAPPVAAAEALTQEPAQAKTPEAAAVESAAAAASSEPSEPSEPEEQPAPAESVAEKSPAPPAVEPGASVTAAAARAESRSGARRPSRGSAEAAAADAPSAAATKAKRPGPRASGSTSQAPVSVVSSAAAEAVDEDASKTGAGSTFNRDAAKAALDGAATQVKNCRPQGGPSGDGSVQLRYDPSGKVSTVSILTPKFQNTTTGDCIVMLFRRATVPAFAGAPVVVMNKTFEIP